MKVANYHGSLRALEEACEMLDGRVECLANPLVGPQIPGLPSSHRLNRLLWRGGILFRHLRLWFKVLARRRAGRIMVREFSTIPFGLLSPLFRPFREKLMLVVNHNLQWAERSPLERRWFRRLVSGGFHFILFETDRMPIVEVLGLSKSQYTLLPHPVTASPAKSKRREDGPLRIGLAGYYRKEKGVDELLEALLKEKVPGWEIVLGLPNAGVFERESKLWRRHDEFSIVDTAGHEAYGRFIAECDVVIQNYAAEAYRFRPSGIVADAAGKGTPVIVPDFPVIHSQVHSPVCIGETFCDIDEIAPLLERVREKMKRGKYDFEGYRKVRNARVLASLLGEAIGHTLPKQV